jgi:2-dehydro-3-deoxyphosphogluconate aldolase/(4S)-4-hydroxy-2-oxoglutarate aldolase
MQATLKRHRLVPVTAVEEAADACRLAEALVGAGLPVVEVTFRTAAAAEVIAAIASAFPDMLVGAGTVLTPDDAQRAKDAGAVFAVAPGCSPAVIEQAAALELPFFPGVATPSDIERGLALGVRTFKFFPAAPAGGVAMLKAIAAPYRHLGVTYCPTGGINAASAPDYLALADVLCVGGTWMAPAADIKAGDWAGIREKASAAVAAVATAES